MLMPAPASNCWRTDERAGRRQWCSDGMVYVAVAGRASSTCQTNRRALRRPASAVHGLYNRLSLYARSCRAWPVRPSARICPSAFSSSGNRPLRLPRSHLRNAISLATQVAGEAERWRLVSHFDRKRGWIQCLLKKRVETAGRAYLHAVWVTGKIAKFKIRIYLVQR